MIATLKHYQKALGELTTEGLNALHDSQPEAAIYIGKLQEQVGRPHKGRLACWPGHWGGWVKSLNDSPRGYVAPSLFFYPQFIFSGDLI